MSPKPLRQTVFLTAIITLNCLVGVGLGWWLWGVVSNFRLLISPPSTSASIIPALDLAELESLKAKSPGR